ncbi:MAG: VWA domain-containing protein, partial [Candidatus Kapabacteria bacterium]|nr:VWA domain-containing protein [Candidatus Kapabacteria bacterium]
MQNEVIPPTADTSNHTTYITSTKPIDSIDTKKVIYDIFRIETYKYPDSIYFYARIYDSLGHFVTNMADPYKKDKSAKYFGKLYEKVGKTYKSRTEVVPEYKIREFGAGDSIPYQIVLTMDYSGSMFNVKEAMFDATNLFIDLKFPYDRIAITSFNSTFEVKVPLMSDYNRIKTLYNAKKEQGFKPMSALNDAVYSSLNLIDTTDTKSPRLLVVFTDGDENYSKKKINEIIKIAKARNIHIFTIGMGYTIDNNLMNMSNYTGGKYYKAKSTSWHVYQEFKEYDNIKFFPENTSEANLL